MKIAIVVGHSARAKGAIRIIDQVPEFTWNMDLAKLIEAINPGCVRLFWRVHEGSYSREVRKVYDAVDAWGADVSIELHFNGSPHSTAEGCLTLTSGSRGSRKLAEEVHTRMLAVMGNEDDGIEVRRTGNGSLALLHGKAPAIIAEPYFGGNARFCHVADARKDQLAEAIYDGAVAAIEALAPA